ncbi:ribonuclease H [Trifolium medium]|uniref:Ribonuclease H n=1 Tax=Trifolium medium TaxID=97028 RepID=A0A392PCU4_9FABA|nr:ribonuclease H [Trifolium medium]
MQRQFIWGDTKHNRRFHAIGWDRITVPKDSGGLGIRKLEAMNKACLLKLNWKLRENSDELWCKVLRAKYECDNSNISSTRRVSTSSLWKALINLQPMIEKFTVWSAGMGEGSMLGVKRG